MNKKIKSKEDAKQEILEFLTQKRRFVEIEEICEKIKLSRPTIRKYLNELIDEGWIKEEK